MINLVRVTSFGRKRQQDKSHLVYINRFGTAHDELGRSITGREREILDRHNNRTSWSKKISTRLSISLPSDATAASEAYDVLREMLSEKFHYYVTAFHADKVNNHAHVYIQNVDKLSFNKLYDKDVFNSEFQNRLEEKGISYSYKRHDKDKPKPKQTQAEIYMKERGQKPWKNDIREAVSLSLAQARDFDSFVVMLQGKGISISRETASTLTFQNADGMKARLNRLFSNMKNRADLEREIAKIQERKAEMISKKEELLRAERAFTNRLYDFADRLLKSGRSEQEVRNRIEFLILRHQTNSENVQERWDALKKMKESLAQEKEKWYDNRNTEYEQQQKLKALQRVMSSDNPIAAFAAALIFLIAELKQQQQKQKQQQEKQKEIEREISMARNILNPPSPAKKQDQKQGNDNIYIDRIFGR